MMVRRAQELARSPGCNGAAERVALGSERELRARLPHCVRWGGQRFRIVELDGEPSVHATTCPHLLGPLDAAEVESGAITCPWHGWRFDIRSGRALDGRHARLAAAPQLVRDPHGNVWLGAP